VLVTSSLRLAANVGSAPAALTTCVSIRVADAFLRPGRNRVVKVALAASRTETRDLTITQIVVNCNYAETQTCNWFSKRPFRGTNRERGG
jgi:hypothetical protein